MEFFLRFFPAFRYRNYRIWFLGQGVSLLGTWMQSVAQGWVMYQMTRSVVALGWLSFSLTIPTLILILPAGVISDRLPRKKVLFLANFLMMVQAFLLTVLSTFHLLTPPILLFLSFLLGVATSFDAPLRQSMVLELVDGDRNALGSAIALNSILFNFSRLLGPALGGVLLGRWGPNLCFLVNTLSFLGVLSALLWIRFSPSTRFHSQRSGGFLNDLKEGFSYVRSEEALLPFLFLAGSLSFFGVSYMTLLPAYAVDVLHLTAGGFGGLHAIVGGGALLGGLFVSSLKSPRKIFVLLVVGAFLFPLSLVGLSLFTTSFFAHIFLLFLGFSFVSQFSSANTWIQTIVKEEFRGRVMSLYTLMFFGLNPFGSLVAGFLAHQYGLLWGIRLGGFLFLLPLGVFLYQTRALWERGGEGIFLRKVATPGSFVERVR